MAAGDIIWFNESKAYMLDGGWEATDAMKCALITTLPTAADATPSLSDYTECTPGGNYAAGGYSLDTWGTMVTQTSGTVTIDTNSNPTWAQHASNPTNARAGLVYNDDQADVALCAVDLGAAINMTTGSLTITWNGSGLATIT